MIVKMTARHSTLLRWTESAEAAEICAYVELEREPHSAAATVRDNPGSAPADRRRPLWPAFVARFAGLGAKVNPRRRSPKKIVD